MELLENIKQKPAKTKKMIAFLCALTFAGLIFVVWLSVLYPDWKASQTNEAKVTAKEPSPLSTFSDMISGSLRGISGEVKNISTAISAFTQVTQGNPDQATTTLQNLQILSTSTDSTLSTSTPVNN
ncbi:MAG: hypothetical protein WCK48_03065 [bacterium]